MRGGSRSRVKIIVPTRVDEKKRPSCCKEGDWRGTRVRKAPIVVMFPIVRGGRTSFRASRTLGV